MSDNLADAFSLLEGTLGGFKSLIFYMQRNLLQGELAVNQAEEGFSIRYFYMILSELGSFFCWSTSFHFGDE